ncbi:hypothetical protein B0H65DRAFT_444518 [Neurospora tetraspora]|uniref:Uncharacterized protein n=1 Tax=Neurospora tetraspora TaxID=94610 RepID=A0AAE0JAS7_9PEZI|nr:hypothetical protein B0H65DRAFT_444518 [Neurospora tetraspora]
MDNSPPPKHPSVGQKLTGKQEEQMEKSIRLLKSKMEKDQWEAAKKRIAEEERKAEAETAAEQQKMKEAAEKVEALALSSRGRTSATNTDKATAEAGVEAGEGDHSVDPLSAGAF